jgi:hypothetical protein
MRTRLALVAFALCIAAAGGSAQLADVRELQRVAFVMKGGVHKEK